jgi:hypothetical protein
MSKSKAQQNQEADDALAAAFATSDEEADTSWADDLPDLPPIPVAEDDTVAELIKKRT